MSGIFQLEMNGGPTTEDLQFMQKFEQRVQQTIEEHNLFSPEDKILVAVSGGKDSTVLLGVLHSLGYPVEALTVDVHIGCYTDENLQRVKKQCEDLGVKLHVRAFREEYGHSVCYIRDAVQEKKQLIFMTDY